MPAFVRGYTIKHTPATANTAYTYPACQAGDVLVQVMIVEAGIGQDEIANRPGDMTRIRSDYVNSNVGPGQMHSQVWTKIAVAGDNAKVVNGPYHTQYYPVDTYTFAIGGAGPAGVKAHGVTTDTTLSGSGSGSDRLIGPVLTFSGEALILRLAYVYFDGASGQGSYWAWENGPPAIVSSSTPTGPGSSTRTRVGFAGSEVVTGTAARPSAYLPDSAFGNHGGAMHYSLAIDSAVGTSRRFLNTRGQRRGRGLTVGGTL